MPNNNPASLIDEDPASQTDSDENNSVLAYSSERTDFLSSDDESTALISSNLNIENDTDTGLHFKECSEGLSVYYTNADNLLSKLDELKVRIQIITPDILIITEIYPKVGKFSDVAVVELHIDNYNLYSLDVKGNSRGVAIYVKETLLPTPNVDLTDQLFAEIVWVNIRLKNNESLLGGGVYRSLQSNTEMTICYYNYYRKLKLPNVLMF